MKTRFMLFSPDDQNGDSPQSTQDQTPQTDQQAVHPTDQNPPADPNREYIAALENTLREQNLRIQQMHNLIESRTAPNNQPAPAAPQPSTEELNQQFYNKPYETTQNLIQQALKETINPLIETVRGLRFEGSPYDRMLTKFKSDPRFSQILQDPTVVSAVGQILEHVELSEQAMQSAIVHAAGLKAVGQLPAYSPTPTPAPTPTPQNPTAVIPPHVRPSAPPAPRGGNGGQPRTREFTENERRIMREQNLTEEQYLKWLELPAGEVAHTTFDKPAPRT